MHYVHLPQENNDTIAAIATAPGEGGVAIIRISGANAVQIASLVFSGPVPTYLSHRAHFGKIYNEAREVIDEGLLLYMKGPKSYTGEDTVEIHCHGGSLISQMVLQAVVHKGARLAKPGEFTKRAYLNGKIDLSQAEAVQKLISAKNALAIRSAKQQLEGKLSETVRSLQKELTEIAAVLEAWVDFPEEGLEFLSIEEAIVILNSIVEKIEKLCRSFHNGKMISDGISLCLIGPPNAGKSSLMNALLGKDRAIVTPIAGTTRDLLEDQMRLGNLHFRIIDTAGIRETEELIEKEGIRRSKLAMQMADLVLCVFDATEPVDEEIAASLDWEKSLVVWNKIDKELAKPLPTRFPHAVALSALRQTHLDDLQTAIETLLKRDSVSMQEEVIITIERHYTALINAKTALQKLIHSLQTQVSAEFVSADMREALNQLGTIIGTHVTEDILSAIFSKFCVGK